MKSPAFLGCYAKGWLLVLPLAACATAALAADPSESDPTHTSSTEAITSRHATSTHAVYHPSSRKAQEVAPGVILTSRESPRPVVMYQASAPHPGEVLYLNESPAEVVQHPMNVASSVAPVMPPSAATPSNEVRRATIVTDDESEQPAPPRAEIVGPPDPPAAPAPRHAKKLLDVSKLPVALPSKHSWYRVVSPFPPYHEMDITGLAAGSLARDPSCGKIFRLP